MGLSGRNDDRCQFLLCQDPEAIEGRIDKKLIAQLYQRIRTLHPLGVAESAPDDPGAERVTRMLVRTGAVRTAGPATVEAGLVAAAGTTGETREEVAGRFRRFTVEGLAGAVCTDEPACTICPMSDLCKHFSRRPSIKELPESERPRERLLKDGPWVLSDADLLGIVIRAGTDKESAVDLAKRLLAQSGNYRELASRSVAELTRINGIGPAKAAQIKAVFEIARRFSTIEFQPGKKFTGSAQVFKHYHEKLKDRKEEQFILLLLDTQHKFIRDLVISKGSLNASVVHPREVLAPAIKESAAAMIFVHNHPSGEAEPSTEDVELTRRLIEASNLVDIKVLDHVIIGNGTYESLAARGLM